MFIFSNDSDNGDDGDNHENGTVATAAGELDNETLIDSISSLMSF